ncbi:hypothetical protein FDECE_15273 [Fusarium decemcellulare]|nr:hypothetical protein FDECE_15273 [Fusarium decemcellulare]
MPETEFVHGDYTVGWVCALPKEQTAATAMLDIRHPDLPKPPTDHNTYTLGTVGNHNVAIACLPKGKYGTNSAAIVATRMLDTFPSIKFGLMVGIGGGIPPKVRLGDVVVSTPTDQYPGVVQWDFGKAEKGGQFRRIGALNNPPSELLTALAKLETAHEMKGSQIPRHLNELATKWPALVPKYLKSDSLKDPLLSSTGLRDDRARWQALFSMICATIVSLFMFLLGRQAFSPRRPAAENGLVDRGGQKASRDMQVHYGLIASGNQVVKDAVFRDELSRRMNGNVLCLEMEAAGLANDFSCFVIRGICDYADSGKNKEWQEHAAAVAAAFAKELLSVVPAHEVSQMRNAKILLGIDSKLDKMSEKVAYLHSAQRNQEHQDILDWLTLIEYAPLQHDNLRRRQPGTGQWLLDSAGYQDWFKTSGQTLFCSGIPGAGKTIITSVVIDELSRLHQDNIGIAYIYCNFRRQDDQRIDKMLASLLKQLAEQQPSLPEVVNDLYDRHKPKTYPRVYFVVDALDECQESEDRRKLLEELFALQENCAANLFMTSRSIPGIQQYFSDSFMELEIRAAEEDVRRYLDSRVDSLPRVVQGNPKLREDIITEVVRAVNGMFLLAELHLNSLKCKFSAKDIRRALKALPTGSTAYDETYKAAMDRIDSQVNTEAFAKKALAWITCARRPLTTSELRHALAVEAGNTEFDPENLAEIDDVVDQYFERTQRRWFPSAEADITTACVTYLSYKTFGSGACRTWGGVDERLQLHQFYDYTANNWGYHARMSLTTNRELMEFLESDGHTEAAAEALMATTESFSHMETPYRMTGLHLAAYFGMAEAIRALFSRVGYKDLKDTRGWTPLAWAAMKNHEAIVKLLLENGADADSRDAYERTPLSLAAEKGHEAIVNFLLATEGVDADSKDQIGSTPLLYAAENGHATVFNMLLTTGKVDIHAENRVRQTPAWAAIESGCADIVKQLFSIGKFDGNSRNVAGETPLIRAVRRRHETLVKLLLATDEILVDLSDKFGRTPLSFAAEDGLESIAKLLIDIGKADLNLTDQNNQTPLSFATGNGHEGVIRLLLRSSQTRADGRNNSGATPLLHATYDGRESIVRRLVATGKAGIDLPDELGFTPLLMAAYQGHESIVRLLLETGQVEIEAKQIEGRTPLMLAAARSNEPIVRLLLEHGADTGVRDIEGQTPLSLAGTKEAITKMLLAAAATGRNPRRTLVPFRAEREHEAVVQLLLSNSMFVETNVDNSQTPPSWATEYDDMIKLHLATGRFDIDAKDQHGSTLLLYASEHGHGAVVKLLLATGVVDINATDNSGRTPLSCAIESGHEHIVKLLVATGKAESFSVFSANAWNALLQDEAMGNLILASFDSNVNEAKSSAKPVLNVGEYEAIFRLLMAIGDFDIQAMNSEGTLMWLAARNGHESLLKLFLDTGKADINLRYGPLGLTLLAIAATKGHENVISLLLSYGDTDVYLRNNDGMTSLQLADKMGHRGVVDLLLSHWYLATSTYYAR